MKSELKHTRRASSRKYTSRHECSLSPSCILHGGMHRRIGKRMHDMLALFLSCWDSSHYSTFGYWSASFPERVKGAQIERCFVCPAGLVFMQNPPMGKMWRTLSHFEKKKRKKKRAVSIVCGMTTAEVRRHVSSSLEIGRSCWHLHFCDTHTLCPLSSYASPMAKWNHF